MTPDPRAVEALADIIGLAKSGAARAHLDGAGVMQDPPHSGRFAECEAPWCVRNQRILAALPEGWTLTPPLPESFHRIDMGPTDLRYLADGRALAQLDAATDTLHPHGHAGAWDAYGWRGGDHEVRSGPTIAAACDAAREALG